MKKKIKPVLPHCEDCGVELHAHVHLDPKRTLCVMDAMIRGVDISRKE